MNTLLEIRTSFLMRANNLNTCYIYYVTKYELKEFDCPKYVIKKVKINLICEILRIELPFIFNQ